MAEGGNLSNEVMPTGKAEAPLKMPWIRVPRQGDLKDPGPEAPPLQKRIFELQQSVREIVKDAGAEPNRGMPYIDAALAEMGYELRGTPTPDEKIELLLAHPNLDLGESISPDTETAMYIQELQPLEPRSKLSPRRIFGNILKK